MSYNCTRVDGTGTCYGGLNDCGDCYPCDTNIGVGEDCSGMVVADGEFALTRGVPSQGSTDFGPRGQRQEFSNTIGPPKPPPLPPPPPMVSCESCQGGLPVTQMFPMMPPGGGSSCPAGWIPSGTGTTTGGLPNANPCNVLGQPGITNTFTTNIHNGYTQFGCSFLYGRLLVQQRKMRFLQQGINPNQALSILMSAGTHPLFSTITAIMNSNTPIAPPGTSGTNPNWQIRLQNRIIYLEGMILEGCTGGPTPYGPTFSGEYSNIEGDIPVRRRIENVVGGGGDECEGATCSGWKACPTCGPNCNCECEDGVCKEVPRDDDDAIHSNFSEEGFGGYNDKMWFND